MDYVAYDHVIKKWYVGDARAIHVSRKIMSFVSVTRLEGNKNVKEPIEIFL